MNRYLTHNGKVKQAFSWVWEDLHVAGYYQGHSEIEVIKEGFKNANIILDTLSKNKTKIKGEK